MLNPAVPLFMTESTLHIASSFIYLPSSLVLPVILWLWLIPNIEIRLLSNLDSSVKWDGGSVGIGVPGWSFSHSERQSTDMVNWLDRDQLPHLTFRYCHPRGHLAVEQYNPVTR